MSELARRPWSLPRALPAAGAALLVIALLALVGCTRAQGKAPFVSTDITGVDWGKNFRLIDVDGRPRTLDDYRGKVVMLFFGYTNCPDVCPITLAKMTHVVERLGADGRGVQGLFVTLDPERDTPEVLRRYMRAFHPDFAALRTDAAGTQAMAHDFKVFYENAKSDAKHRSEVDHSDGIFVYDPRGRLRLYMSPDIAADSIVHDLKLLLDEPGDR